MSRETLGLLLGFLAVCMFAGTLPLTHLAVEGLSPYFVTAGRAAVAGLLAGTTLVLLRRRPPARRQIATFVLIAGCLVVGFPGFTALAMQEVPASHGGVVLGILPLTTSLMSALLAGERPGAAFWLAAAAGAALVVGFTLVEGGGALGVGDIYLLAAVAVTALGYVLSAKLVQTGMAGWEVISWVLVVALPLSLPVAIWLFPSAPLAVPAWSWIGFAYVTVISQYLGFFAWNAGLALGGIALVSQVQLLQTFITLVLAWWLNGESVSWTAWIVAAAVLGLVIAAKHASAAKPG